MERFYSKVDKTGDCWLWTGCRLSNGYGQFYYKGRNHGAHRVSYILSHGEIPEGCVVMHSCDNPQCVNPAHLSLGSHTDNMKDMARKLRQANRKLTPDDVRKIRKAEGSLRAIGRKFGVDHATISQIKKGLIWKEVI